MNTFVTIRSACVVRVLDWHVVTGISSTHWTCIMTVPTMHYMSSTSSSCMMRWKLRSTCALISLSTNCQTRSLPTINTGQAGECIETSFLLSHLILLQAFPPQASAENSSAQCAILFTRWGVNILQTKRQWQKIIIFNQGGNGFLWGTNQIFPRGVNYFQTKRWWPRMVG